jgi:small-conductance mechanosensitive channel/CRP-like cAMP-binding protein
VTELSHHNLIAPAFVTILAFVMFGFAPDIAARLGYVPGIGTAQILRDASGVLAWLALAWFTARCCDILLVRAARAEGRAAPYPRLLHDLLRAVLFGCAIVAILLLVFEGSGTGLIATSSVLIAVIGFALRNIIGDIFSGIAVGVDQPYRIGDWIEAVPGSAGRVVEINWRATRLVTREGIAIVVPNGLIASNRLVNYSAPETSLRVMLPVALDPAVPVDRAKRVLLSGALDAARIFPDLRPDVLIKEYADSGVVFLVRFWVPDYGQENVCRDAVGSSVLLSLQRAGLNLSYPKHDLLLARSRNAVPDRHPRHEALLAYIDLFQMFDEKERQDLAVAMKESFFRKGATIVREGDEGSSVFILAEGVLDVKRQAGTGGPRTIDRMVPGDVFGEMSLLTGQPRSASVIAATDAVVCEIRKDDLDPILRRRPEIADGLAVIMAERQQLNVEKTRALDQPPLPARLPSKEDLLGRIRSLFHLR